MYTVCVADLRASRSPVYAYTGSPCISSRVDNLLSSRQLGAAAAASEVYLYRRVKHRQTPPIAAGVCCSPRSSEVGYSVIVRSGSAFLANRSNKQAICQPRLSRSNCDSPLFLYTCHFPSRFTTLSCYM